MRDTVNPRASNTVVYEWDGEGVVSNKRQKRKDYKAFKFNNAYVHIGDYVLVRNDDSMEPESVRFCFVGKVESLYESELLEDDDKCRAVVQWYSRIMEIPRSSQLKISNPDYKQELVQDHRSQWDTDIAIETIFSKCAVVFIPICVSGEMISELKEPGGLPLFFCRWKYDGRQLEPVLDEGETQRIAKATRRTYSVSQNKLKPSRRNGICNGSGIMEDELLSLQLEVLVTTRNQKTKKERKIQKSVKKNRAVVHGKGNLQSKEHPCIVDEDVLCKTPIKESNGSKKPLVTPIKIALSPPSITKKEKNLKDTYKECCSLASLNKNSLSSNNTPEDIGKWSRAKKLNVETLAEMMTNDSELLQKETTENYDFAESTALESGRKMRRLKKIDDIASALLEDAKAKLYPDKTETEQALKAQVSHLPMRKSRRQIEKCKSENKTPLRKSERKLKKNISTRNDDDFYITSTFKKVPVKSRLKKIQSEENETEQNDDITCGKRRKTPQTKNVLRSRRRLSLSDKGEQLYSEEEEEYEFTEDEYEPLSNSTEDEDSDDDFTYSISSKRRCTPQMKRSSSLKKRVLASEKKSNRRSSFSRKKYLASLTPTVESRAHPCETLKTPLEKTRSRLHVSAVPDTLPCRENEFSDIFTFVESKLLEKSGGCMYISGVPGTGKTATVFEVVRCLMEAMDNGDVPKFNFIEVNAMRLTNPHQCYVHLVKELKGEHVTSDHAAEILEKYFSQSATQRQSLVLLVDELDLLWTRRQDVMYNIFEWPNRLESKLIVLAVANTMDLPERIMMNRISSRLGLTRMTFQPYNHKQLQEILLSRMQVFGTFDPDAVQLVARKVAAISGDARRALNVCRRAAELAEQEAAISKNEKYLIGMSHVNDALQEMFTSPKIVAMRCASLQEQFFLKSVVAEFLRSGTEEASFSAVYQQHIALCRLEGIFPPTASEVSAICSRLGSCRLLLMEAGKADIYQRIRLNVSVDDVNFALQDF